MDEPEENFESEIKKCISDLASSIEEVKGNYNGIREEIHDMAVVVKDFKSLLKRKPLFERSTFTYLTPLAKEIKAETMREVSSKLVGPTEELKRLKAEIQITLEEVSEKTFELKSLVSELTQENKALQNENESMRENISMMQRNIDDAREDLMLKAPYQEINKLVEKIATKSTIEEVNLLSEKIAQCPSIEQVNFLNQQLSVLNQQMISLASKDMVKDMESSLMVNVDNKFESYVSSKNLQDEVDRLMSLIRDTNDTIDFMKVKSEKADIFQKKELEKVQKMLQARPWVKDIEIVSSFIDDKTNQKDFDTFKNDTVPQLVFFDEKVNLFNKRIEGFDRVLERYDEIILDKASKDDVAEIKEVLPKLLLSVDFEYFKEIDSKQKEVLDDRISMNHTTVQEVDKQIGKFNASYKSFKLLMKEFNSKYTSIKEMGYQLESKADKSDIYAMFDCTARREEVKIATQAMEVLRKQLEMIVMFQLVSVKTMLKNSDSAKMKNRQRTDVYKNLNSLMEWISHSIPPEIDKLLDSARSILAVSYRKSSPQELDDSQELMLPLLSQKKKFNRHAVSMTPAPNKSFVDLPY